MYLLRTVLFAEDTVPHWIDNAPVFTEFTIQWSGHTNKQIIITQSISAIMGELQISVGTRERDGVFITYVVIQIILKLSGSKEQIFIIS